MDDQPFIHPEFVNHVAAGNAQRVRHALPGLFRRLPRLLPADLRKEPQTDGVRHIAHVAPPGFYGTAREQSPMPNMLSDCMCGTPIKRHFREFRRDDDLEQAMGYLIQLVTKRVSIGRFLDLWSCCQCGRYFGLNTIENVSDPRNIPECQERARIECVTRLFYFWKECRRGQCVCQRTHIIK